LDDSLPKYLNSPETSVFSKGRELYGLSELLDKSSKPKRVLVVEGYMDVLALAQFGVGYSVAALGTATSKIHLDLLFRFTSEIVFCFDGDKAGQKAAWKAVQEVFPCLKDGRQVRIMLLPEGQDPDSLIRVLGVERFEAEIEKAQALSDYFFEYIGEGVRLETEEGQSLLLSKAKPYLDKIPASFFREKMFERLLRETSGRALENLARPAMLVSGQLQPKNRPINKASPVRIVVAHLLQNPQLIDIVEQRELDLSAVVLPGVEVLKEVLQVIEDIKPQNSAVLMEYFRGRPAEKVISTLINWDFFILSDGVEAEFLGAIDLMLQQVDEEQLNKLLDKEKQSGLSLDERERLKQLLVKKII
jgi:DNA primase